MKEIRTKKQSELHNLLAVSRRKLRELRFKDANRQLGNVREIRIVKQEIARVLTMLNAQNKEIAVKTEVKPVIEDNKETK